MNRMLPVCLLLTTALCSTATVRPALQTVRTFREELRDAMEHPERHEDLIVRVGGYSEYFNRLSPALKAAVLERNIHEA